MASRIQGITVEIGGDTTKLSKALGYYVSVAKFTNEEGGCLNRYGNSGRFSCFGEKNQKYQK